MACDRRGYREAIALRDDSSIAGCASMVLWHRCGRSDGVAVRAWVEMVVREVIRAEIWHFFPRSCGLRDKRL